MPAYSSTGQLATDTEGGWTKVEKRKAKKQRKVEGKLDVCVSVRVQGLATNLQGSYIYVQASTPRFLYNKGEIVKRRDSVGINVSSYSPLYVINTELA